MRPASDHGPPPGQADIWECALGLLARREHTALELHQKLREKLRARGCADSDIAATLARLREQGLQSDDRYTEAYARARVNKGYGPLHILSELRRRGVAEGLAEACLSRYKADWRRLAEAARRKKFGDGLAGDYQEQGRQARFLQQRGFSDSQIRDCLHRPSEGES